jgi:RNA polymerase sigma-70 factor (ECF subfamily)
MLCDDRQLSPSQSRGEDIDLVHSCRNGDVSAFEELVKRHQGKIFRIAQHILHNREDAQDVVQEAFLKAFRNLEQFQENAQFSTWLVRITINQSLMKLRKPHRKHEIAIAPDVQTETGEVPHEVPDWRPNPEELYRKSELRAILLQELQALPPALSLVFVLRDMEGLSIEQTSESLAVSPAAVKTRLMRARLQLRERLSSYFKKTAPRSLPNLVPANY